MPEPSLTTVSVIGIAAGSSVLAAFVTQVLTVLRERFLTKRDGTYSALYLAAQLESYASLASSWLSDTETHEASGGQVGTAHGNVPDLAPYNEDIDWKALKIGATDAALSFRVEVESTKAMITDAWDVVGDEDYVLPTILEETARLGIKALSMATGMRAKWGIPAVRYASYDWNVQVHLRGRIAHYNESRRKREELNRRSWEKLDAAVAANAIAPSEPATKP